MKNRSAAYSEVHSALRSGRLLKPKRCARCRKARKVQAHHDDHAKPLEVRWLCSRCHGLGRKAVLMAYQIPADVKAKCKRDGISIRAVILSLLREWLAR